MVKRLESKLNFLREAGKPGCTFKIVEVKSAMDIFMAVLEVPFGRKIEQKLPLTTKLTIEKR